MRPLLACLLVALVGGCETFRLFQDYETAESADVAAAAYPRLVEVPDAPPPGRFSDAVPDPAIGQAQIAGFGPETEAAEARRRVVAAPVVDLTAEAEAAERAKRLRQRAAQPVLTPQDRAALRGRRAPLGPVLSEDDRQLLDRTADPIPE
ncbi:MAG: hypothetical protein ACFBSD_08565 [Paracoccaceae bacterium]